MSADNIIYVKKEGSVWKVWETGFSDIDPQVPATAKEFPDKDAALEYAQEQDSEHFVEYGVAVYEKDGKSIREQVSELSEQYQEEFDEDPVDG